MAQTVSFEMWVSGVVVNLIEPEQDKMTCACIGNEHALLRLDALYEPVVVNCAQLPSSEKASRNWAKPDPMRHAICELGLVHEWRPHKVTGLCGFLRRFG